MQVLDEAEAADGHAFPAGHAVHCAEPATLTHDNDTSTTMQCSEGHRGSDFPLVEWDDHRGNLKKTKMPKECKTHLYMPAAHGSSMLSVVHGQK